jgi:hypothetical protein
MATAERLAQRVAGHGGAALVIDYGKDGPYSDSLMAIRQHQGVHALSQPGSADLSAWVDFGALRLAAEASGAAVRGGGWGGRRGGGAHGAPGPGLPSPPTSPRSRPPATPAPTPPGPLRPNPQ